MNSTGGKRFYGISRREDDIFQGRVVRQHGNEHVSIFGGLRGCFGDPRTQGRERFGTASSPVVNSQIMPGANKVAGHPRSHVSQTDEPYFHSLCPLLSVVS